MEIVVLVGALVGLLWIVSSGESDGTDYSSATANFSEPETLGAAVGDAMQGQSQSNIEKWALLIQQQEGNAPGSRSNRNNNPGNIRGMVPGAVGTDTDGFAIFPTADAGMAALVSDLTAKTRKYPNYSLLQIMTRYLGGDAKNPPADGKVYANGKYQGNALTRANGLASAFGVSVSTTLAQLFG